MNIDDIEKHLIVKPGQKISLKKDFDPDFGEEELDKKEAKAMLEDNIKDLAEYQSKLYAQSTYSLLIVFQALDAAGKDGTIKHVMSGLNPQGCQVHSFKAPSQEELSHDYLWRCVKALPERGHIGIFNRSYYEEVLIARVHPEILAKQNLPPLAKDVDIWKQRFEEINNFEKYLVDNGTVILKFFLNVSKGEQKERFLERIETPEKNWKFSTEDVREREYWDAYQDAYEHCFNHTSTEHAPWYIIPANHKPFMRVAVGRIIHQKLKSLKLDYPKIDDDQKIRLEKVKEMLESK